MTDHTPLHDRTPPWANGHYYGEPIQRPPAPPSWLIDEQPEPHPVRSHRRPPSPKRIAIVSFVIAFVLSIIVGLGVAALSGRLGTDSGVAACRLIAAPGPSPSARSDQASFEKKDQDVKAYGKLRKMFADSRHDDLRRAGVQLVDVAVQIVQYPDGALALISTFSSAYAATAGACGAHGVPLPPIGSD
jgi:hypothetical protein